MKKRSISIGDVFNKWTVQSSPFVVKKVYYVTAKCKCGTVKDVKKNNLLTGKSKSCGCTQKENLPKISKNKPSWNKKDNFEIGARQIFEQYKHSAKTRNLSFGLTFDFIKEKIKENCVYCNASPSNVKIVNGAPISYNGLDRWDNSLGYDADNVVVCCKKCNYSKGTMDGSAFFEHMQLILQNNNLSIKLTDKKIQYYIKRLEAAASNSPDAETKVGAILVDPKTGAVLAEGYNGFVRGANDDILPKTRPDKYNYIIHAETNMIANAVKAGVSTDQKFLFCSLSPCVKCLRMLWQAGISEIYFIEKYKDFNDSLNMGDLKAVVSQEGNIFRMNIGIA